MDRWLTITRACWRLRSLSEDVSQIVAELEQIGLVKSAEQLFQVELELLRLRLQLLDPPLQGREPPTHKHRSSELPF